MGKWMREVERRKEKDRTHAGSSLILPLSSLSRLSPSPYLVQVGLHQLKDDVDVLEVAGARRQHDVADLHDVRVAEQAQQLDLSQDACRVGDVVEHVVDLLDGDLGTRQGVDGGADDAVGALACEWRGRRGGEGGERERERERLRAARAGPRAR